jgi:glyoxylase-like metal-dependent hydrolase (beta-lactamase superfamily II)
VLPSDAPARPAAGTPCLIVDPGFEPQLVVAAVRELSLAPQAIVLTHAHADHIAGVEDVVRSLAKLSPKDGLAIMVHGLEAGWLQDPKANLSAGMGLPVVAPGATRLLSHAESVVLPRLAGGEDAWKVLHTPGHSPGSVSLVLHAQGSAPAAIVGDCLFAGSVGRTDFPGSDHATLLSSVRTQLYALPDETTIYPGHGPESTIGREKKSNPFVRGE